MLDLKSVRDYFHEDMHTSTLNALNQNSELDRAAWWASASFEGSGSWISPPWSIRNNKDFRIHDRQYLSLIRNHLLIHPIRELDPGTYVCSCSHRTILSRKCTKTVYHNVCCHKNRGMHTARHNAVQDAVVKEIRDRIPAAICSEIPRYDVDVLEYTGRDANRQKRVSADAKIFIGNDHKILDFVVSNPGSYVSVDGEFYPNLFANDANRYKEDFKIKKYSRLVSDQVKNLVPFAVETTGRIGPMATAYLDSLFPPKFRGKCTYKSLIRRIVYIVAKYSAIGNSCMIDRLTLVE